MSLCENFFQVTNHVKKHGPSNSKYSPAGLVRNRLRRLLTKRMIAREKIAREKIAAFKKQTSPCLRSDPPQQVRFYDIVSINLHE